MLQIIPSMVSSCNMFLHFDTYITKGCRAGKLTFARFKDHITKWWTIRWRLPAPKNKPREAIYRHHVGNNLCKMSYICTSLTFKYAYFDLSEWRSFITDWKNSSAEALSKVTRKMSGWAHWNKIWEQWNGKLILNPSYWTVPKTCLF